jgi:hypothetical protein
MKRSILILTLLTGILGGLLGGCAKYPYGVNYYRNNPHCGSINGHYHHL